MARRRSAREDVLDWWQAVLDETRELVDHGPDRLRGHQDLRWQAEIAELRELVSELATRVDEAMPAGGSGSSPP